jgi:ribosomal protein L14E/L6E/L27E
LKTTLTNAIDERGITVSWPNISDDEKLPSRIRTKMGLPKLITSTRIDSTNNTKTNNEAVDVGLTGESESLINTSGDEKQHSRIRST